MSSTADRYDIHRGDFKSYVRKNMILNPETKNSKAIYFIQKMYATLFKYRG